MIRHFRNPLCRISLFLSFLVGLVPARAQDVPRALSPGKVVSDSLPQKGLHTFSLVTQKGWFVYGEVEQITVDVDIKILNPAGVNIVSFDNPARGPEPFYFSTDTSGTYRIEVRPFQEETGRYSIEVFKHEPAATTPVGKLDQLMSRHDKPGVPGGVVTVVRDGKVVLSKGYGLANLEYNIPNTSSTPFHLASLSKQFTAFAVVMLAQQGRLSLSDNIRKHLPEVPDFGRTITLRHLLNHTSGLRDQWNLWSMAGHRMDDVIRQEDLLRLIRHQQELNFNPGDEYLYCNSGYMLLAETVARVSGMPFGAWMKQNILDPLGMTNTQVYDDHQRIVAGRAYSYVNGPEGIQKAVLSYANSGATSLFSTSEDMVKWLRNWKSGQVGGPEALRAMVERGILNKGDTTTYALGVGVSTHKGRRIIAHGGADAGFRSHIAYFPEIDLGVVTMGNYSAFDAGGIAMQIVETLYPDDFVQPPPRPDRPQPASAPDSVAPWKPGPDELRAYAGRYYSPELETFYTVSVKDSVLIAYHRRLGEITLTPQKKAPEFRGNQFALQNVEFVRSNDGTVTEMLASNGRVRKLRMKREKVMSDK